MSDDPTVITDPEGRRWRAPSLASADRELVRWGGFAAFSRLALPHVPQMPAKPIWSWHLVEVCNHFEALMPFSHSGVTELVINIPPGHTKSSLVGVCGDAWAWTVDPSLMFMHAGFDPANSSRHAEYTVNLMQSRWYVERWGNLLVNPSNRNMYYTAGGGYRFSTSVGSKGTGWHGHVYTVDDPVKAKDAMAADGDKRAAMLRAANEWLGSSVLTRASGAEIHLCLMMQRLHEADASGFIAERFQEFDSFQWLSLPWKFEPHRRCVTRIGGDRRTRAGEIISPHKSPAALAKLAAGWGGWEGAMIQSQYQQNPTPASGSTFKRSTFKRFSQAERPLKDTLACLSVDAAFKKTTDSDFVAIEVWGYQSGDYLCYYSDCERRTFTQTLAAILDVIAVWPGIMTALIEDKANGSAIIDTLGAVLARSGIIVQPIEPEGGKEVRANAASHYFKAGRVHFLEGATWYDAKTENLVKFPRGKNDDDVDATTQAIIWLAKEYGAAEDFEAAAEKWREEEREAEAQRAQLAGFAQAQIEARMTGGEAAAARKGAGIALGVARGMLA